MTCSWGARGVLNEASDLLTAFIAQTGTFPKDQATKMRMAGKTFEMIGAQLKKDGQTDKARQFMVETESIYRSYVRGNPGHEMVHLGKRLQLEQRRGAPAARPAHPPQVVAQQVNDHQVFRPVPNPDQMSVRIDETRHDDSLAGINVAGHSPGFDQGIAFPFTSLLLIILFHGVEIHG